MLEEHPKVGAQLDEELIGWLTTVDSHHQPQSSPIWFIRDGNDLVLYSRPNATRLTNLATNDHVAFNLRGDRRGDTIVTLEGTAAPQPAAPTPLGVLAYMRKYGDEMVRLGWTHDRYDNEFPVAIRIVVTRVRAWTW